MVYVAAEVTYVQVPITDLFIGTPCLSRVDILPFAFTYESKPLTAFAKARFASPSSTRMSKRSGGRLGVSASLQPHKSRLAAQEQVAMERTVASLLGTHIEFGLLPASRRCRIPPSRRPPRSRRYDHRRRDRRRRVGTFIGSWDEECRAPRRPPPGASVWVKQGFDLNTCRRRTSPVPADPRCGVPRYRPAGQPAGQPETHKGKCGVGLSR
jgi:hypothetical protein